MELVLPVSGISVELSPMKYKDEKIFTDEKLVKQGKNYDYVISTKKRKVIYFTFPYQ